VQPFSVAVGDQVRVTKNFKEGRTRLLNNSLHTITSVSPLKVTLGDVELSTAKALHLDQGFAVTSHAAQGKTVDEVIVSAPVDSFSQVNQAQFYVSMSRARESMHLFTDSKAALREAVSKPSSRLSPIELLQNQSRENLARTVRPEISRMATPGSKQPDHQILVR
jgi:ATP-dependent exoDNAse (exonuclease V) alpha subunit